MRHVHLGFLDDRREASLSDPDTLIYVYRSKIQNKTRSTGGELDQNMTEFVDTFAPKIPTNQPADRLIPPPGRNERLDEHFN